MEHTEFIKGLMQEAILKYKTTVVNKVRFRYSRYKGKDPEPVVNEAVKYCELLEKKLDSLF